MNSYAKYIIKSVFIIICMLQGQAFAIGLGQPVVHSSLGQPLNIEVVILVVEDYSDEQLNFVIAPMKVYEQFGVEFSHLHHKLKFSIKQGEPDRKVLVISTLKPVNEPFINFIMEMRSPEGKVIKEMSLLLDTPSLITTQK